MDLVDLIERQFGWKFGGYKAFNIAFNLIVSKAPGMLLPEGMLRETLEKYSQLKGSRNRTIKFGLVSKHLSQQMNHMD